MEDLTQSTMFKQAILTNIAHSGGGNAVSSQSPDASPPHGALPPSWPPTYQSSRPTSVPVSSAFQPSIPDAIVTDALMNQYGGLLASRRNPAVEEALPQHSQPQSSVHFPEYEALSSIEATMQGCYQGLLAHRRLGDFDFCERGMPHWEEGEMAERDGEVTPFPFIDSCTNAASGAHASREKAYCSPLGKLSH